MKRIFTFFSLLISMQVYAETSDASFTPTDQRLIDTINQTYQTITFVNDVSTSMYMCPNASDVKNAALTMKDSDNNYFKDSQQLSWEMDIPPDLKDTTLIGFYAAEYKNNYISCSYQIANSNVRINLLGVFYVVKPIYAPWMGVPDSNAPTCNAGQNQCTFQLLKNPASKPTQNPTPIPLVPAPPARPSRTEAMLPPDQTSSIPMPGEITG